MKCIELIMQDHLILRRGLDILDGMTHKLEGGERIEIADVTTVLKFFRVFGDEYHQEAEEKVLFPALRCAGAEESPLPLLVSEHGDERLLVTEIGEALQSKRGMSFLQASRRLSQFLRNHLDKEDAIFPHLVEQYFSKEQDSEVADEFPKIRKEPEIQANFSRLEFKYMPRPHRAPMGLSREFVRGAAASSE